MSTTVKWEVAVVFDDEGHFTRGAVSLNGNLAGNVTDLKSGININGGEIRVRFSTNRELWMKMQPLVRFATDEEMKPIADAVAEDIQKIEDAKFVEEIDRQIAARKEEIADNFAESIRDTLREGIVSSLDYTADRARIVGYSSGDFLGPSNIEQAAVRFVGDRAQFKFYKDMPEPAQKYIMYAVWERIIKNGFPKQSYELACVMKDMAEHVIRSLFLYGILWNRLGEGLIFEGKELEGFDPWATTINVTLEV